MGGLIALIFKLASWVAVAAAARWGLRIGLVAAVVGAYVSAFALVLTAVAAGRSMLVAAWPGSAGVLQFVPSSSVLATGFGFYLGTLAVLKAADYWVQALGVSAKIGAP